MKDKVIDFISDLMSVILGIVITFAIQGMIDRSHDRKEVASALDLVRTELATNIDDIGSLAAYLRQEKKAAAYFSEHRKNLGACPDDSLDYHMGILFADASISVCSDALELLKNSSQFQKIGDNDLSMKIIRAYDCCTSIAAGMNGHLSERGERFERVLASQAPGQFSFGDRASTREFIRSFLRITYGAYSIPWLANQPDPGCYSDVSDVEAAIEAIDRYLHRK